MLFKRPFRRTLRVTLLPPPRSRASKHAVLLNFVGILLRLKLALTTTPLEEGKAAPAPDTLQPLFVGWRMMKSSYDGNHRKSHEEVKFRGVTRVTHAWMHFISVLFIQL